MNRISQGLAIFILVMMLHVSAWANACTATNPAGNWGTAGTWTNCGGVAPTSADTCAISGTGTLTVESSVLGTDVCGTTDFTGFTGTLAQSGTHALDIYGGLTIVSGMTYAPATTSVLRLKGTAGPYTIKSGGKTMGPTIIDGVGGSYVLGDAWAMATVVPNFTVTNGGFDTGNFNMTGLMLSSSNSNVRSITCGTSTFSFAATAGVFWDLDTTTNLTFSCASSTITAGAASSVAATFNGGGLTYGTFQDTVNNTGTVTITGANTFGTLTLSQSSNTGAFGGYGYLFGANQTVTGTCTFNSNSVLNRDFIQSSVKGTQRTISCATVTTNGGNFEDINGTGAGNWNISGQIYGAGDLGGNTGITFNTPKTCYMVNGGNSVNFSANNWRTTSGGSTGCTPSIPLPQDTAVIDSTGWTGASKNLTIDASVLWIPALDLSAAPAGMTLVFTNNALYTHDIKLGSSHSISGTGTITVSGSGTRTIGITTAGQTITGAINLQNLAPTVTFQKKDALTDSRAVATAIHVTSGIWDNNGFTTTLSNASGLITMDGGTFLTSANMINSANGNVFTQSALVSSPVTAKTGYKITNIDYNQVTVAASAGGGSCTFGQNDNYKSIDDLLTRAM